MPKHACDITLIKLLNVA